jgi:L-ascorbate metabolism protein UlaG (beta-lactamase superfamily)
MNRRSIPALFAAFALVACTRSAPSPARAPPPPAASPVTLTYLGVAGWEVASGSHALLVDPYFTRAHVESADTPLVPDASAIARYAPARADVILVEHSHYDHLLDVPAIAQRTGATIVGTESTANVARAAGVGEPRLAVVHGGDALSFGPFAVRAIRGLHSLTGQADAPIPRDVTLPMPARGYNEGGTLQYLVQVEGRAILFVGSANFVDRELEGLRPDVAAIAVGLREKIPDYACRLMRALGRPPIVLTNHFDAHGEPLGPKQMDIGDESRASLAAFADEIHACAPDTKVVVPQHLQSIPL